MNKSILIKSFNIGIIVITFFIITSISSLITIINPTQFYDNVLLEKNISQLVSYKTRLLNGEAQQMQKLFPEGEFFSYALYGYSWINMALQTNDKQTRQRAYTESIWVLEELEKENVKNVFDHDGMSLEYGVFYEGWYNRLLAGTLLVDSSNEDLIKKLEINSEKLANAFNESKSPFLEAYPSSIWPCDSTAAISSLSIANKLLDNKYEDVVNIWISDVRSYLEQNDLDLLLHTIDFKNYSPIEGPPGTSSVYSLIFLKDIDAKFSYNYYQIYSQVFRSEIYGFELYREYPVGMNKGEDVDTGPMIFEWAATPTVTSAGVSRIFKDQESFEKLITLQEILGFRYSDEYLLGQLLVFDGFNIWSKTAVNWFDEDMNFGAIQSRNWLLEPIIYILLIIMIPTLIINYLLWSGK